MGRKKKQNGGSPERGKGDQLGGNLHVEPAERARLQHEVQRLSDLEHSVVIQLQSARAHLQLANAKAALLSAVADVTWADAKLMELHSGKGKGVSDWSLTGAMFKAVRAERGVYSFSKSVRAELGGSDSDGLSVRTDATDVRSTSGESTSGESTSGESTDDDLSVRGDASANDGLGVSGMSDSHDDGPGSNSGDRCGSSDNCDASDKFNAQKLTKGDLSVSGDMGTSKSLGAGDTSTSMVDHPSGDSSDEGHDSCSTHDLSTGEGCVSSGHTSVRGVGDCCGSSDNCDTSEKFIAQKLTKSDLSVRGDMGNSKSWGAGNTSTSMADHPSVDSSDEGHDSSSTHDLSTDEGSVSSGRTSVRGVGGCCGSSDNCDASGKFNAQELTRGDLGVSGDMGTCKSLGADETSTRKGLCHDWSTNGELDTQNLDDELCIGRFNAQKLTKGDLSVSVCANVSINKERESETMAAPSGALVAIDLAEFVESERKDSENVVSGSGNGLNLEPANSAAGGTSTCSEREHGNDGHSVGGTSGLSVSGDMGASKDLNESGMSTKNCSGSEVCKIDAFDTQSMTVVSLSVSGKRGNEGGNSCGSLDIGDAELGEGQFNAQKLSIGGLIVGGVSASKCLGAGGTSASNGLGGVGCTSTGTINRFTKRLLVEQPVSTAAATIANAAVGASTGEGTSADLCNVNMFNTQELTNDGVSVREGLMDDDMSSVIARARILGQQYARSLRLPGQPGCVGLDVRECFKRECQKWLVEHGGAQNMHNAGNVSPSICVSSGDPCWKESKPPSRGMHDSDIIRRARQIAAKSQQQLMPRVTDAALSSSKSPRHPDQLDSQGVNSPGYP